MFTVCCICKLSNMLLNCLQMILPQQLMVKIPTISLSQLADISEFKPFFDLHEAGELHYENASTVFIMLHNVTMTVPGFLVRSMWCTIGKLYYYLSVVGWK